MEYKGNEFWLPIQNFEGKYWVSDQGRIFNGKKFMKSRLTTDGDYLQIGLRKNGKYYTFLVHRLVALAFIPNPENKPQVNHKDGNRYNNWTYNLEWNTALENNHHSIHVLGNKPGGGGSPPIRCGVDNKMSKAVYQVKENGEIVNVWSSMGEAERLGGFSRRMITTCCINPNRRHKGFYWCYA